MSDTGRMTLRERLDPTRGLRSAPAGRRALAVLGGLAAVTLAGLIALWPGDAGGVVEPLVAGTAERGDVTAVQRGGCPQLGDPRCRRLTVVVRSGPDEGRAVPVVLPGDEVAPEVQAGDRIRILRVDPATDPGLGSQAAGAAEPVGQYAFVDFQRRGPLVWLVLLFVALVIVLGRWRGVRALAGLAISLAIVLAFVAPSILDGNSALAVAVVGAVAVMFVTIAPMQGLSASSVAALLSAALTIVATALLALAFVKLGNVTGFMAEEAQFIEGGREGALSLQGLVIAGVTVATLGILADACVGHATAVVGLRRAGPALPLRDLIAAAVAAGRDRLGPMVTTLALAYAGASLPLLLVFHTQGTAFGDALNRDSVAGVAIAMLVGSIGLMAALPITSAVAAALVTRLPDDALGDFGHGR